MMRSPIRPPAWIDTVAALHAAPPSHAVVWAPLAREQAEWLQAGWSVDFRERLEEILARDPRPHRTRRTRALPGGDLEIGCGAWRAVFQVRDSAVEIVALKPSFPVRFLQESRRRKDVPDREAQPAFLERWPCPELEFYGRAARGSVAGLIAGVLVPGHHPSDTYPDHPGWPAWGRPCRRAVVVWETPLRHERLRRSLLSGVVA
jgi:hypothetical protein